MGSLPFSGYLKLGDLKRAHWILLCGQIQALHLGQEYHQSDVMSFSVRPVHEHLSVCPDIGAVNFDPSQPGVFEPLGFSSSASLSLCSCYDRFPCLHPCPFDFLRSVSVSLFISVVLSGFLFSLPLPPPLTLALALSLSRLLKCIQVPLTPATGLTHS